MSTPDSEFETMVKKQKQIASLIEQNQRLVQVHSMLARQFMLVMDKAKGFLEVKDPELYEDCMKAYEQLNNYEVLQPALEVEAMAMELATLKAEK